MTQTETDQQYMRIALDEARQAYDADEVPIGAVVVSARGRVIGRGHNLTEALSDVSAHAEMQALTAAAATLGGKYLSGCTLYVTCGALSDVCRSDRVVTVVEDSIRCVRPQARLPFVSTFTHPFSSACHCHARSPGGRMCGTNAIFFQVETLIAYIKQPL